MSFIRYKPHGHSLLRPFLGVAATAGIALAAGATAPPAHSLSSGGFSSLFSGQLIDIERETQSSPTGTSQPERRRLYALQGRSVTVSGKVKRPVPPGRTRARFQIRTSKKWKTVRSARVGRKSGRFRLPVKVSAAAKYRYRVVLSSSNQSRAQISAMSPVLTGHITVYKPIVATWFGPGFYGNRMACGPVLTKHNIAVAHPSLPCGSRVELFANGRVLKTTVQDVCACNIDLTAGAAKALRMNSTTSIGVRVLRKNKKR